MIDILCKDIIRCLSINRVVETGTDKGETIAQVSRWFAEFYPEFGKIIGNEKSIARSYRLGNEPITYPVFSGAKPGHYQIYSVDTDQHSYQMARERFKSNCNIALFQSSSDVFLTSFLEKEALEHNHYLFFLDAHWGKYWPLRDEIKVIQKLDKYLIVIDDFFVPGKSDPARPYGRFGFDMYQHVVLSWGYVCDLFEGIKVRVFYPDTPNRDQRGWVLITRGYDDRELDFLRSLPLFEMDPADKKHTMPVKTVWRSYWNLKSLIKAGVSINALRNVHRAYERFAG